MLNITNVEAMETLLGALGEQLAATGERFELVVVGGSGLLALGTIERATRDVDVLALLADADLCDPEPLPGGLLDARARVARDFSLPEDWLNPGPSGLLRFGLPKGFVERLEARSFGTHLVVHFASRYDQIHLKLYATVDQGPGKHLRDLEALTPTGGELLTAARWAQTHDPSPGFAEALGQALAHFGVEDEAVGP